MFGGVVSESCHGKTDAANSALMGRECRLNSQAALEGDQVLPSDVRKKGPKLIVKGDPEDRALDVVPKVIGGVREGRAEGEITMSIRGTLRRPKTKSSAGLADS